MRPLQMFVLVKKRKVEILFKMHKIYILSNWWGKTVISPTSQRDFVKNYDYLLLWEHYSNNFQFFEIQFKLTSV